MLLNNTAQPTIVIPQETEQRVEQGGHNLQRLPKTLTFIEYGGSWPGPQEEARSPQFFFFSVAGHKFNLNYNLRGQKKAPAFACSRLNWPSSRAPSRGKGKELTVRSVTCDPDSSAVL